MAKNPKPEPSPTPAHLQGGGAQQPNQPQTVTITTTTTTGEMFAERAGPIPDPIELAAYDKALPGLAERIVVMAESEQRVRLAAIESETKNRYFEIRAGRIFSFAFSLTVCGVAALAIIKEYPYGAAIVFGLHIAGVCARLIGERIKR
jgi:uncharacterized membrane protein